MISLLHVLLCTHPHPSQHSLFFFQFKMATITVMTSSLQVILILFRVTNFPISYNSMLPPPNAFLKNFFLSLFFLRQNTNELIKEKQAKSGYCHWPGTERVRKSRFSQELIFLFPSVSSVPTQLSALGQEDSKAQEPPSSKIH